MREGYLTTAEVMKKYKKTYTQVRYATGQGRLQAEKVGWIYIYPVAQLPEHWPESPRNGGKS